MQEVVKNPFWSKWNDGTIPEYYIRETRKTTWGEILIPPLIAIVIIVGICILGFVFR